MDSNKINSSYLHAAPILIGLVLFMIILAGCERPETTLERAKKIGVIRIGFANDIPYGYATPDGALTGEAPEIARRVLAQIGINKIEGVFTEFGSLIPALKAGRFDIIAAGMFVTPDRCKEINFSEPTYRIGQAFLVKAGNPHNLHSYKDVAANSEAILCVMDGAVEGKYAEASGIPPSQIISVPDTPSGLKAVQSGRANALALTSLSIQKLIKNANDPSIEQAKPFENPSIDGKEVLGYGGFGFRKDDHNLYTEFNRHLKAFIGSKEHIELVKPFGFTEFPGDITAAGLCEGN